MRGLLLDRYLGSQKPREILTLLCCITLSSSRENQRSAQEVARRISGAVAGEFTHKSRHTKYPSQTLVPCITLFAICLLFSSPPLHPCRFIRPLFSVRLFSRASCLLVCWIACLSRRLKIIPNCVTLLIPTTMISLTLRLLLLPILNLVKLMLLC